MGFDFSALDAELDALGKPPADVLQLAERFAGAIRGAEDADAPLRALGEPVDLARFAVRAPVSAPSLGPRSVEPEFAAPAPFLSAVPMPEPTDDQEVDVALEGLDADAPAAPSERPGFVSPLAVGGSAPESGELALPEPVRRQEDPISGELSLDADAPSSGSFELPEQLEEDDDATRVDEHELSPATPLSEAPALQVEALADDDADSEDVFAALEGLPDPKSGEARLRGLSDLPATNITRVDSRDPDAEFEAIFSDATSPSGIPTRGFSGGFDDDSPSAEELLTGLEAPSVASDEDEALSAEEGDYTEVLDSRTLNSITSTAQVDKPHRPDQTLDSSEFEIMVDDAEIVEPDQPKRSPPPPLPPSGSTPLDKRPPSFLGRLFGRKDQPNEP